MMLPQNYRYNGSKSKRKPGPPRKFTVPIFIFALLSIAFLGEDILKSSLRSLKRRTADDKGTIAYVVCITGCPEWYEHAGTVGASDEPIIATDFYEASAILKAEVREMTEQANAVRRLGQTRKLRRLGDQLSAAEMNYTM